MLVNKLCLIFITVASVLFTCQQKPQHLNKPANKRIKDEYPIRVDFRFGRRYFSLHTNESGQAFVQKGYGSYFTEKLIASPSDSIIAFKLDSIKSFFIQIKRLRNSPHIYSHVNTDAPRVEAYYENKKMLDQSQGSAKSMEFCRPIFTNLPHGFNPFYADEKPFGF